MTNFTITGLVIEEFAAIGPTLVDVGWQDVPLPVALHAQVHTIDDPCHRHTVGVRHVHLVGSVVEGHNVLTFVLVVFKPFFFRHLHLCQCVGFESTVVH